MNQLAPIVGKRSVHSGSSWGSIVFLATRDLASEKLISLCLVLSVVAVLTPIMLLTSVKIGFIDRLQSQFIQDPSFREIRPADADIRQQDFFEDVRTWPGVAFAMPSVMLVPREVDLLFAGHQAAEQARLLPSSPDDPLFVSLEGAPPEGDSVVVSSDLAESGGLSIGSVFDILVDRVEDDQRKRVKFPVTVSGIVPNEVVPQPTIFGAPALDRAVENYRAGVAVTDRGWAGIVSTPQQSFESLLLLSDAALGETSTSNLRIKLSATAVVQVDAADIADRVNWADIAPASSYSHLYVVEKDGRRFTGNDLADVAAILRNTNVRAIGVNPPLAGTFLDHSVMIAGPDPALDPAIASMATDWRIGPEAGYGLNDTVFLPQPLYAAWEAAGRAAVLPLKVNLPDGASTPTLTINVRVAGMVPVGDEMLVSPSMLAMLYRGIAIPLAFDTVSNSIAEQSVGYRGFRVIATGIDTVPELVESFVERGIAVRAKSDEILKLRQLERSLDILVLVVASVALSGGFAILSASFFANVQRKRVDFATMRLIGMTKRSIFRIPIVQAVVIAWLGFALSCALYLLVSLLLNLVIAVQLGFDGQLSKLYFAHFAFVGLFVVAGSCIASLFASREVTRIDPAQAIRAA